jgi:uncharacterized protein with HEPN domain
MSPGDWRDRVRDILDAISEIQRFTQGMDYETFKKDDKSIRTTCRPWSLNWKNFSSL